MLLVDVDIILFAPPDCSGVPEATGFPNLVVGIGSSGGLRLI